jgi:hypothetical protein
MPDPTGQDTGQSRSTDLTKLGSQPDWPPAPSAYRRTKSTPSGYVEYSDLLTIGALEGRCLAGGHGRLTRNEPTRGKCFAGTSSPQTRAVLREQKVAVPFPCPFGRETAGNSGRWRTTLM